MSAPRAFVKEMYALLSKNQLCTELFSAPAMAQFTAHLRNAILEKVKQEGIDSTQYENIGAVLVFIFNGIAGLQASAPELAEAQLDTIATFVEGGVRVLTNA